MKKIILSGVIILIATMANAQFRDFFRFNSGGLVSIQWNISSPTGDMKASTSITTLKGVSIDYRHCYKQNFIFGGRTGWHTFYEDRGITDIKNGISTNYIKNENTISAIPILFVVDYMVPSQKFIPYAGIGLGGYFIRTTNITNISGTQNNNSFHFGVSPEVGITIPTIISNFGFNISTRYNFVLKSAGTSNFSWFDFNIGLSFMY